MFSIQKSDGKNLLELLPTDRSLVTKLYKHCDISGSHVSE
jgi:hypothetical protein